MFMLGVQLRFIQAELAGCGGNADGQTGTAVNTLPQLIFKVPETDRVVRVSDIQKTFVNGMLQALAIGLFTGAHLFI